MSYRNPRFSYRHMLREYKTQGIGANFSPLASGTFSSLYDDRQKGPLVEWPPGLKYFDVMKNGAKTDEGLTLSGGRLNRIIMPAGHNLATRMSIAIHKGLTFLPAEMTGSMKLADGVTYGRFVPSSGMLDIEIDTSHALQIDMILFRFYLRSFTGAANTTHSPANLGLSELWWTDTVSPSTGIAHSWDATDDAIFDRHETRSGATFRQKRGQRKRRWVHTHRNLSGADLKLYDDMRIATGHGLHPFWYEHPDSGDAKQLLLDWEGSAADRTALLAEVVTTGNDTVITQGPSGNGNGFYLTHTSNAGFWVVEWKIPTAASKAPGASWKNRVLQFQMTANWLPDDITSNQNVDTWVKFFVESDVGGTPARTIYNIGHACVEQSSGWQRIDIDIDNDASGFTGPGPADLDAPTHFGFITTREAASNSYYSSFTLIDKDKQPVLVEAVNYSRGQDSPSPSSGEGPTFQIAMGLLEVTA